MSGSIGGNRIKREHVKPTVDKYIKDVLKNFNGYKSCEISGSYNAGTRADHGDIDLVVHIEASDLKQLKKDFKKYIEELPDEICPPFRSGRNEGKKAQLYGNLVTCQVPIVGKEEDYVQVDNIIVTTKDEAHFQKSFLDLEASKQVLFTGLVRVLKDSIKEKAYKHFGIENLPELESNQEFEFVLSSAGLSLRKVTLSDERKETKREEIWRSAKWDDVEYLLSDWDFSKSYDELLKITAKEITDERSRKRICGVMKSMINIGPGEVGTPKGDAKEKSIKDAYRILNVNESINESSEELKRVNMILGKFQPITAGHLKIQELMFKENNLPSVWCLVTNKKFDSKHPFADELISEEINICLKDRKDYAGHIYITNADIVKCAEKLHEAGFEPILWGCGTDRYDRYKIQADKYKDKANLLPEFDCFEVKRTDDDISATKVREAIKANDFETFEKMMPKGVNKKLFEDFKEAMSQIKEGLVDLVDYLENYIIIVD